MSKQPAKPRRSVEIPAEPLDAAPALLAQRAAERAAQEALPPAAPPPGSKKRDRSWDARRSKATYDLPTGLIERIKEITDDLAQQHGAKIKVSDVARLLLEAGLERYEAGDIRVEPQPAKFTLF
jgi:hypothetical protein